MDLLEWILPSLRFASPLVLAAMAGLIAERSGVIQIGLEGLMLFGAFFAAVAAHGSEGPVSSLLVGALVGAGFGVFYGFLTVKLRADQIVAGTALNLLAWGGIPFLSKVLFGTTANTPALGIASRLSGHSTIFIAAASVCIVYWMLNRSNVGLWLGFAGEKPEALKVAGVDVLRVRFVAVCLSGFLAGLSGATLSLALSSGYTRNMAAGRGFIALAAIILGKWRVLPTLMACLLFGFCEVLQLRLQSVSWGQLGDIPIQWIQMIPYVLTLILLSGFVGESRAPKALGQHM